MVDASLRRRLVPLAARMLTGLRTAWNKGASMLSGGLRPLRRLPDRSLRPIARIMPKGLYPRALVIVIAPVVLLQSVVAYVFMERHWQTVTQRLSSAVASEISTLIDVYESYPQDNDATILGRIAEERLGMDVEILPDTDLPAPGPRPFFSLLDSALSTELAQQVKRPFWLDTVGRSSLIEIRIKLGKDVMRVLTRRSQAYASNSHIFLLWMMGTSLILLTIAVLFLRNQIRPILRLADAAEAFGKGRDAEFRPRGAREVRRAGNAFIEMKRRVERSIGERTMMLNGVSHDLRTILTRFKLQLALAGDNPDLEGLDKDVEDMQSMLEAYLTFARTDVEEDVGTLELPALLEKIGHDFELHGKKFSYELYNIERIIARPNALSRLVANLAENARRYAGNLHIDIRKAPRSIIMTFDDDGPGIPENSREDVFKPFFRLDEARNLNASGTGLGLSIVRDIARSHGGDVTLDESTMGGLRVIVKIPA